MNTETAPKPIIRSQRHRVIQKIESEVAKSIGLRTDRLFTIYHPRLCQMVHLGELLDRKFKDERVLNIVADAALFTVPQGLEVHGPPTLLVFLDRSPQEYEPFIAELKRRQIPYLFESEKNVLAELRLPPEVSKTPSKVSPDNSRPFGFSENKVLTAIAAAMNRKELSGEVLLTGQTVLNTFTDFPGFGRSGYQTDCDLLICTPPPVSFPLLGIEIDGPSHYCLKFLREEQKRNEAGAIRELKNQKRKQAEKDRAFKSAEIPVLHIRVNKQTRKTLEQNLDLLAKVISDLISYTSIELLQRKRYKYVRSVSDQFQRAKRHFFSEAPELEDLANIIPELLEYLVSSLADYDKELAERKECDARSFEDLTISDQHAQATVFQLFDAQRNAIIQTPIEELTSLLHHPISIRPSNNLSTLKYSIQVVFAPPTGEKRVLKGQSNQSIPWLEVEGYNAETMKKVLNESLAKHLGLRLFRQLNSEQKTKWQQSILEHLDWQETLWHRKFAKEEIERHYQRNGIQTFFERIDHLLGSAIIQKMKEREYISDPVDSDGTIGFLIGKLHWVHKDRPRPESWSEDGEHRSVQLAKLMDVVPELDEVTRQKISDKLKQVTEDQVALLKATQIEPSDLDAIQAHILDLRSKLRQSL